MKKTRGGYGVSEAELALVERSNNHTQTEVAHVPENWFEKEPAVGKLSSEAVQRALAAEQERPVPHEINAAGRRFLSGFVTDDDLESLLFTPDQISQLAAGLVRLRGPLNSKEVQRDYQRIAEIFLAHDGSLRRVNGEVFPDSGASSASNALVALQKKCKAAATDGISIERILQLGNPEREVTIESRTAHELGGAASIGIIVQPHGVPLRKRGAQMLPSTGLPPRQRSEEDYDDEPLAWQVDALCSQTDPEAFFPEKGGSTRSAKQICTDCEVRDICLNYALQNDERFGIWGGLSERERRKLKKRVA